MKTTLKLLLSAVLLLGVQPVRADELEEAAKKAAAILQGHGQAEVPAAGQASPVPLTGPQAAYDLYSKSRGAAKRSLFGEVYPEGKPISLDSCKNITQLRMGDGAKDAGLWTRAQIEADFLKHKETLAKTDPKAAEALKGAIVMVKTEYCCQDSRLCAASTAVLEAGAEPALKSFKVYAFQINPDTEIIEKFANDDKSHLQSRAQELSKLMGKRTAAQQAWEKKVIEEYGFEQGPGARWVAFTPGVEGVEATDAAALELDASSFEDAYKTAKEGDGKTRPVQKWAKGVLDKWEEAKTPAGPPQS